VQHLAGALPRPQHHPGVDAGQRDELELDRGDRGERAAAAAQRPEEVGLGAAVGADEAPVGGDDLDCQHALGGQAVAARQPADAAAERETDHADVGGGARQRCEADFGRGLDDLGP
jgi:hypothetical protein